MRVPAALLVVLVASGVAGTAQAPLPDAETFLAEARKRLASNADLRSRYAYRERRTEMNFNPFGRMGTGPLQTYEVFPGPTPELTYRRLVERDGRPVPEREIAAQDREHLAKIEAHDRERARESAGDRARREAGERRERAEARAEQDEVMGFFDFSLVGRDRVDEHPAIVVRFTPRPDARPRSREARVAAAFEGRAWVHEHQYELMRLEASAVKNVSFGFGMLARLHEGATVTLARAPMGSGRWLPSETRFAGTGRALVLRHVTFDALYEYSNYRPFDPDQLASMLAGAGSPTGAQPRPRTQR